MFDEPEATVDAGGDYRFPLGEEAPTLVDVAARGWQAAVTGIT